MRNILITGGAGFIGSHLVKYFVKKYTSYNIINVDKLTYASNVDFLNEISSFKNYKFVQADICHSEKIETIFEKYNISDVIHLAAESHVDNSIENSIEVQYKIDNKKNIFLNFRNFWSTATYDEKLFKLKKDGYREISDYGLLNKNPNTNFNLWNLDLNFEWWFAPGSNLVFLYRNQIFNRNNESGLDYYKSLKKLFDIPIEHQLSLRINYLIDVNRFKKNNTKTSKRIL